MSPFAAPSRWLGLAAFAWLTAAAACASSDDGPASTTTPLPDAGASENDAATVAPDVTLLGVFDLPRTADTQSLSGAWYDATKKQLVTIPDRLPRFLPLQASDDLGSWTVGTPISLSGRGEEPWDGEGITRVGDVFFAVTNETTPIVERFDLTGKLLGKVELPARYAKQAAGNKGLESLSSSPSGKYLFTANEAALTTDGPIATATRGTLVRILRRELATSKDEERPYRTEPLGRGTGGDMGVSDVTATDDDHLLVLERGYQSGFGNTVRLFSVAYAGGEDVSGRDALDETVHPLAKTLVVDFATLPADGVTHPSTQPNPILDNYEALALGPVLPDGRRIVFVLSDDNASKTQVARILTLALRLP